MDEEPSLLIDVNSFSSDGSISYQRGTVSPDGNLLAFGLNEAGSDWTEMRIRDIETEKDYPNTLKHLKSVAVSWTNDNKGFFYCVNQKVFWKNFDIFSNLKFFKTAL